MQPKQVVIPLGTSQVQIIADLYFPPDNLLNIRLEQGDTDRKHQIIFQLADGTSCELACFGILLLGSTQLAAP